MMRRPRNLFEIRDWGFGSQVSVHEPDLPSEFFLYSIPSSVLYKEGAGGQGNGQAVGEQHLAAIRQLFDYLVTGGILPSKPLGRYATRYFRR